MHCSFGILFLQKNGWSDARLNSVHGCRLRTLNSEPGVRSPCVKVASRQVMSGRTTDEAGYELESATINAGDIASATEKSRNRMIYGYNI